MLLQRHDLVISRQCALLLVTSLPGTVEACARLQGSAQARLSALQKFEMLLGQVQPCHAINAFVRNAHNMGTRAPQRSPYHSTTPRS